MTWQVQKMCMDVKDYELQIEKQKTSAHCEQPYGSWKWLIHRHGAAIATGNTNSMEDAQAQALANVPT